MFWIPLMVAATVASTALSAASSLAAGRASKAGAQASAEAARLEGLNAHLRATQLGELSRQRLMSTISTQQAIFAGRGTTGDSATAQAIERKTVDNAYRDEGAQVLAELNRESSANMQSAGYSLAAKYAMPLAGLDAASKVAGGIANISTVMAPKMAPKGGS